MCNTVEKLFHGDRVLFLLDCCASGNLCDYLPSSTSSSSSSTTTKMTTPTSNYCNNSEIRVDGDDDTAVAVAVAAHNNTNNNDNTKTKQYLLLASRCVMLRFFVVVGFIYQFYYFSLFFLFLTISSSIYINLVITLNRLSKYQFKVLHT